MKGTSRRSSSAPYQLAVSACRSEPMTSENSVSGVRGLQRLHRAQGAALAAQLAPRRR